MKLDFNLTEKSKLAEQGKEVTSKVSKRPTPQDGGLDAHTSTPTLQTCSVDKVVIAKKAVSKGALYGFVKNGDGQIPLSDLCSVRLVSLNDNFAQIEVAMHGSKPKYQSWKASKKVKETKPKAPETKKQGDVTL